MPLLDRGEQSPLNQVLGEFYLVNVVIQRLGAFEGDLAGLFGRRFVHSFAAGNSSALTARQGIGGTPPMTTLALRTRRRRCL